jgi:hypothetical protein
VHGRGTVMSMRLLVHDRGTLLLMHTFSSFNMGVLWRCGLLSCRAGAQEVPWS